MTSAVMLIAPLSSERGDEADLVSTVLQKHREEEEKKKKVRIVLLVAQNDR